jgi:hypothetical protein
MRPGRLLRILILFLPFSLLFAACSQEYKLAKQFRTEPPEFHLLVTPPSYLFKFNHKGEVIEGFDSLTEVQQDSALFASSHFIQQVDDSIFLEAYVNNFVDELRTLGFTIHLGSEAAAPVLDSIPQSYKLQMAQVQIDEYFYPVEEHEYLFDTLFYKRFDLNALDFSAWYELSNWHKKNGSITLYSTQSVSDDFEGNFVMDPFQSGVKYKYSIDSLLVDDVYEIGKYLGRVHGSYLYDFFLNQYILFHLPGNYRPQYYYHYNRFRDRFDPVQDERMEILDN